MIYAIEKSRACGMVTIPASKSIAHRLLINAALTEGTVKIKNLPINEDISATADCLKVLGAEISIAKDGECTVRGIKKKADKTAHDSDVRSLCCRESGSTLRFLIPIALCDSIKTEFTGAGRLFARPHGVYQDICEKNGFLWEQSPSGITVQGKLLRDTYSFPGNISSQFITGLLLALPEIEGDSRIVLTTPPESNSYVDLTVDALAKFGIKIERKSDCEIYIPGGQKRHCEEELCVEADESGAAFFGALDTLYGDVTLEGLSDKSKQGDRVWRELFSLVKNTNPTISIKDCPDLGPILMVMAALHNGATLTDTARLKLKESDRGNAMAQELEKCGVKVSVEENRITVEGGKVKTPDTVLNGYNDHRIVMSLAVLLTKVGGKINDAEAVGKSMPEFWNLFNSLGCKAEPCKDE